MATSDSTSKTIEIITKRGVSIIVDERDADLASLKWYCTNNGYIARRESGGNVHKSILMHRVILERMLNRPLLKTEYCDHRDLNRLNNTRENLRVATPSQNQSNRTKQSNNTSGYKGVTFKKGRWCAKIGFNHAKIHIGYFDTPEEAYIAYCLTAKKLNGEFVNVDVQDKVKALTSQIDKLNNQINQARQQIAQLLSDLES